MSKYGDMMAHPNHLGGLSITRFTHFTIEVSQINNLRKLLILFCKILQNRQRHRKALLKSFHLNGHTLGFIPQTQKLELHQTTQGLNLKVKGL